MFINSDWITFNRLVHKNRLCIVGGAGGHKNNFGLPIPTNSMSNFVIKQLQALDSPLLRLGPGDDARVVEGMGGRNNTCNNIVINTLTEEKLDNIDGVTFIIFLHFFLLLKSI